MGTMEFNTQLTNLQDNLTYFANTLTQNNDDAKDLVQETYLKALTYREKFEANTNLKAWAYTIMKNTFINNYRRSTKVNMIMDSTADLYFLNSSRTSSEASPESVIAHKEVSKAVDNLVDGHRIPFRMHHEGYKYKEIAKHLDLSIGTIKSRIFFSRKKLMDSLTRDDQR
ncbi:MAG: RNA polymerase subunit sigma [Bacteroidetes bacterium 4484_276]|nr:MAG: RNA polymerase subunit sigma [Bacteroidetes bacterium 4484_276]OYT14336.1 MAG: RNA polymerase subunit sigma [Bacteroidetes bacterium 4572_114]